MKLTYSIKGVLFQTDVSNEVVEINVATKQNRTTVVLKAKKDIKIESAEILEPYSSMIFETFEYNYHQSPLLAIGIKNTKGTFIVDPNIIFNSM